MAEIASGLKFSEQYLFKAHGTINSLNSIIFSRNDYRKLTNENRAYSQYFSNLFSTKSVLFVGFSMRDQDTMLIIDELCSIFPIFPINHYATMDEMVATPILQRRFANDYNITILSYNNDNGDHKEVNLMIQELLHEVQEKRRQISIALEVSGQQAGAQSYFRWDVAASGYTWEQLRPMEFLTGPEDETVWVLTDNVPLGTARDVNRYNPLTFDPRLFRAFAALEATRDSVQAFANTYGFLGARAQMHVALPVGLDTPVAIAGQSTSRPGNFTMARGETLDAWESEISALREALRLWDGAIKGDTEMLQRYILWRDDGSVEYDNHPELPQGEPPVFGTHNHRLIAAPRLTPDLSRTFNQGDVIKPALTLAQEFANEHLEGLVSPRLLWNPERNRLTLYHVPGSLLGALWLLLAQAIHDSMASETTHDNEVR
jgi:hypothetical protein